MKARILVIDDEAEIRDSVRMILRVRRLRSHRGRERTGRHRAGRDAKSPDLVFLDIKMPGMDGLEVLQQAPGGERDLPVVIISGHGTVSTAVEATKAGAFDFIEKPLVERDAAACRSGTRSSGRACRDENRSLRRAVEVRHQMVGESPSLRQVLATRSSARRRPTRRCCIRGESGVGKELVARSIHRNSLRSRERFVQVNCAAIPEELIESELFGHEKGSFTGATEKQIGKFEQADRGTIFLDEVGDMSAKTQAKVLRVLQEGEVERLGSARTIKVDVRVIAATNKDLEEEIEKGHVPRGPLLPAERDPDSRAAAARAARGHPGARPALRRPLQPREQPAAAALHARGAGASADGALEGQRPRAEEHRRAADHHDARRHASTSATCRDIVRLEPKPAGRAPTATSERPGTLREFKESAERAFLVEKLRENDWNISKTAEVIGTPRSNLYKKLEQYGISQEGTARKPPQQTRQSSAFAPSALRWTSPRRSL